jgi:hypothetical protein
MPAASFVSTSTLTKHLPDVEEKALFLFFFYEFLGMLEGPDCLCLFRYQGFFHLLALYNLLDVVAENLLLSSQQWLSSVSE